MNLHDVDFEALEKRARRERAEAVSRLLIQPVLRLFRHPAPPAKALAAVLTRASA